MLEKNGEYVGIIESFGANGEGILKVEGQVVFILGAILGERVKYKILKIEKKFAYAKLLEVYSPAEERARPKCKAYGKCGGCQLQHIIYREQLKIKSKTVSDCFAKNAYINIKPFNVSTGDDKYNYRNKLQIPIAETCQGTKIGFFAVNSHRIVPVDDCPINKEWAGPIISVIKDYIEKYRIHGYTEITGQGLLRHLVVREIEAKFVITLVATNEKLPGLNYLIEQLKGVAREFSLYININKTNTNVVFGKQFICVYGSEKMSGIYNGIKFEFGPESFLQVNDSVCRKLYDKVVELSLLDEDRVVIDAYSGAGIMTALLAKKSKKAIGIECVSEAVDCANRLCELNSFEDKMQNICGECETVLPELIPRLKKQGEKLSIVLDPPRKGCDIKVLNAIMESGIERIVYVSCNPATLARDVGILTGTVAYNEDGELKKDAELFNEAQKKGILANGLMPFSNSRELSDEKCEDAQSAPAYEFVTSKGKYAITYLQCFDMFPMTKHIETLCVLSHKTADEHITVKVDFEDKKERQE